MVVPEEEFRVVPPPLSIRPITLGLSSAPLSKPGERSFPRKSLGSFPLLSAYVHRWFREVIRASQQTKVNGRSPKSLGSSPPSQHTSQRWFREVIGASQQTKVNSRSPKSLGSSPSSQHTSTDGLGKSSALLSKPR